MAAPAAELDLIGLRCPLPVLRLERRLAGLAPGALVRVLSDDPVSVIDIPNHCREAGHEVLSGEALAGGGMAFVVRKG